jgi:RNA polymerase sigma factor (TIGR02999 family)
MAEKPESKDPLLSPELFSLLYDELRKYAKSRMANERTNHTLQATAVVNELWFKLGEAGRKQEWKSRGHFFGSMARAIRQILVDYARFKNAGKHGGGVVHQPCDDVELVAEADREDLIDLDRALKKLESIDPQAAEIVNLRYFAGVTIPEIAEALGVSGSTVDRKWSTARKWLLVELKGEGRGWIESVGDA